MKKIIVALSITCIAIALIATGQPAQAQQELYRPISEEEYNARTQGGDECAYSNPFLVSVGIEEGTLIACGCIDSKAETKCGLKEVGITITNFGRIILGITGSALLLMFIYGGTLMIISGTTGKGDKRRNQGKDTIQAAITGLLIIFCAWIIVNFIVNALTGQPIDQQAEVFDAQIGEQR